MKKEYGYFIQKPLRQAISHHNKIKEGTLSRYGITLESCLGEINGLKIIFRANLKLIMSIPNNVKIPKELDKEKLNEIYEKSDFGWRNWERFLEFREWYLKNIYEPYIKGSR